MFTNRYEYKLKSVCVHIFLKDLLQSHYLKPNDNGDQDDDNPTKDNDK